MASLIIGSRMRLTIKAGEILRHRNPFAELGDELFGRLEGRVAGGNAADHLDQLHQRYRIHEMNADETLRAVGRGGKPRDRDRRGVGADDGFGLERRTERGKDLALDFFLFSRRLDHQIAIGEFVERLGRRNALDRRLPLFIADTLTADLPRQIAADGRQAFADAVGSDVVQQDVKARQRANEGDAVAHLAGADNADLAKRRSGVARFCAARALRARAGPFFRAFFYLDHLGSPYAIYDDLGQSARFRQRLTLSSSAASSGSA